MKKVIVNGEVMYEPTDDERQSLQSALKGVQEALKSVRPMTDEELAEWEKTASPEALKAREGLSQAIKEMEPLTQRIKDDLKNTPIEEL